MGVRVSRDFHCDQDRPQDRKPPTWLANPHNLATNPNPSTYRKGWGEGLGGGVGHLKTTPTKVVRNVGEYKVATKIQACCDKVATFLTGLLSDLIY